MAKRRLPLFYLLDSVCQVSKAKSQKEYRELVAKHLNDIVGLIVPDEGDSRDKAYPVVAKVGTPTQLRGVGTRPLPSQRHRCLTYFVFIFNPFIFLILSSIGKKIVDITNHGTVMYQQTKRLILLDSLNIFLIVNIN